MRKLSPEINTARGMKRRGTSIFRDPHGVPIQVSSASGLDLCVGRDVAYSHRGKGSHAHAGLIATQYDHSEIAVDIAHLADNLLPEITHSATPDLFTTAELPDIEDDRLLHDSDLAHSGSASGEHFDDSGTDLNRNPELNHVSIPTGQQEHIDADHASITSISTTESRGQRRDLLHLPFGALRRRSSLIRNGASPRPRSSKTLPPCPLCRIKFGESTVGVHAHLRKHSEELKGEHACQSCQVGFRRVADLERHQQCAKNGNCGFEFDHEDLCQGHHPPVMDGQGFSDHDRFKLLYKLRDWEQSPLQAYLRHVDDFFNSDGVSADPKCWSIDVVFRRSMESMTSVLSNLKLISAPDFIDYQACLNIETSRVSTRTRLTATTYSTVRNTARRVRTIGTDAHEDDVWQLIVAANAGDLDKSMRLVSKGTNVNASLTGKEDYRSADILLDAGFDYCYDLGRPLFAAARGGYKEIVELLLENGARVNVHDRGTTFGTALCVAAASGNLDAVSSLRKFGADISGPGSHRYGSALCCAAYNGHAETVVFLLENGANTNANSGECGSALASASRKGHVDLLLAFGARVDIRGKYGQTALCHAVSQDSEIIARAFLLHGGSVDTSITQIALVQADSPGNCGVLDLLLEHGADVETELYPYGTMLAHACV